MSEGEGLKVHKERYHVSTRRSSAHDSNKLYFSKVPVTEPYEN
jgi:hypothetical protein